jgi:hypothetical protein
MYKVVLGQVFSEYFGFPLPILIPLISTRSPSSVIRGWYNMPNSDRSTKWTQSHPILNKKNYLRDYTASLPAKNKRFFSTLQRPDWLWSPPSLLFNGYSRLSPRVKRPGREAYHSPPYSAEVKNSGAKPSLPHMSSCDGA